MSLKFFMVSFFLGTEYLFTPFPYTIPFFTLPLPLLHPLCCCLSCSAIAMPHPMYSNSVFGDHSDGLQHKEYMILGRVIGLHSDLGFFNF